MPTNLSGNNKWHLSSHEIRLGKRKLVTMIKVPPLMALHIFLNYIIRSTATLLRLFLTKSRPGLVDLQVGDNQPTRNNIAVVYLARGATVRERDAITPFAQSYKNQPAGIRHELYVVIKGFDKEHERQKAISTFQGLATKFFEFRDDSFDLGAFAEAATLIKEETVVFLNTFSIIRVSGWLFKLVLALQESGVLAGSTASYERCPVVSKAFPSKFPNPHIRTNAFIVDRNFFLRAVEKRKFRTKSDAFDFESGPNSMTAVAISEGHAPVIAGANGESFSCQLWPRSGTFRVGRQSNLLVSDNQTDYFDRAKLVKRIALSHGAWGGH